MPSTGRGNSRNPSWVEDRYNYLTLSDFVCNVIGNSCHCHCVPAGVCLGMQLAVCEYARNVIGWKGKIEEIIFTLTLFCLFVCFYSCWKQGWRSFCEHKKQLSLWLCPRRNLTIDKDILWNVWSSVGTCPLTDSGASCAKCSRTASEHKWASSVFHSGTMFLLFDSFILSTALMGLTEKLSFVSSVQGTISQRHCCLVNIFSLANSSWGKMFLFPGSSSMECTLIQRHVVL